MLLHKNLFPISKVCDSENTRYALNGVCLQRDAEGPVAVVTDGRRLIAVRWPELPPDEIPASLGDGTHKADFETLIPKKDWDAMGKLAAKTKDWGNRPIVQSVLVEEPSANGKVNLAHTDLETVRKSEVRSLAGRFPRWRDVLPSYDASNSVTVSVNAEYLASVLSILAKMTNDCHKSVEIKVPLEAGRAIEVNLETAEGIRATGIVMQLAKKE